VNSSQIKFINEAHNIASRYFGSTFPNPVVGCIIANEVTRKIMDLSIDIGKSIGFGILTSENLAQALERSDSDKKIKRAEVARACHKLLYKKNIIT